MPMDPVVRCPASRVSFNAEYCRDNRWDIFFRACQVLNAMYQDETGLELRPEEFAKALGAAGARAEQGSGSGGRPRVDTRPLAALAGEQREIVLFAYSDGSVGIEGQ